MKPHEIRTCAACGAKFSATNENEFCPVCILREALGGGVESGECSFEDRVNAKHEDAVQRFEHYELVKSEDGTPIELGRGAMGVTYKARDVDLQRIVTLKVISEKYLGDEAARLRFLREARAAASVRHPNVASVLHLGRTGSSYFYAMEFVEGETLERLIRRSGPLEAKLALDIATQVAAGLAAVHKQKLVHRDIKPGNIMVSMEDGGAVAVKIIDLGLAKAVDETPGSQSEISTPGGFAGTPEFASPEQFAGVPVDIRSDLYSLGATLWETVTGHTLFKGSPSEVMHQHQHAPLPLEQLREVPQPFVVLLEALLQKDPAKRPQSPGELQALLQMLAVDPRTKHKAGKPSLSAADAKRHRFGWRGSKQVIASVALLFVAAAGVFYWFLPKSVSPGAPSKSVAVLPFENFSESKENSYFSDGLMSEVIFQLSKVADLRVISRQSVLRYRDVPVEHQKSLSQIGRELNVAAILESSVERIDDRVRIITGLYDAATNKRLWGASYDREIKDIFAIQSDVAEQITAALKAGLSPDERANIKQKPTENVAAYDFYLRGWGLYQFYQKDENEKAIDLFKQAIDADPKFALAYTGLADAYIERVQRFHGADFWSDSAVDLCQRSVALDPKEVRSYTELARAFLNRGWHERAHEPIRKALELNPNDWRANRFAAEELYGTGRYDEMYAYLRKCYAVNPNDSYAPNLMSYICWMVNEKDLMEQWMQRAINVETGPQARLLMQCELLVLRGDYAAAKPGLEQLPPGFYGNTFSASGLLIDCFAHLNDFAGQLQFLDGLKKSGDTQRGRNPATLVMSEAIALHGLGRETEAKQAVERCESLASNFLATKKYDGYFNHWLLAFCARFLGRKGEAYQHVQDSFANGDVVFQGFLPDGPSTWIFKPDPEFQAILAERNKQNVPKRARILAIEKSYQT
ncbi:MAG: protein kinase [Verrucomicrobia bacterium]|nr:protein kinase [Verrucomicrobiota bacterium]